MGVAAGPDGFVPGDACGGDIRRQIAVVGFWENSTKQDELRKSVKRTLDDSNLFAYDDLDELAVDLVALAKANQQRLR